MNDATARARRGLGIAVLGSIAASRYAGKMEPFLRGLNPADQSAARTSIAGAHRVAATLPQPAQNALTTAADHAFVGGIHLAVTIGAVLALERGDRLPLPAALPDGGGRAARPGRVGRGRGGAGYRGRAACSRTSSTTANAPADRRRCRRLDRASGRGAVVSFDATGSSASSSRRSEWWPACRSRHTFHVSAPRSTGSVNSRMRNVHSTDGEADVELLRPDVLRAREQQHRRRTSSTPTPIAVRIGRSLGRSSRWCSAWSWVTRRSRNGHRYSSTKVIPGNAIAGQNSSETLYGPMCR